MAQVKLGDVIGVLPGFLQAGRLMVEKEVFLKAAGLQQTLEQVVGEFQQPQAVTDLPVHLEAENGEHQDRQHAEQEGQDDLAPDLVSGFFHQWVFYSPSGATHRTLAKRIFLTIVLSLARTHGQDQ